MAWTEHVITAGTLATTLALTGCAGDRVNPFADGDTSDSAETQSTAASTTGTATSTSTDGGPGGGDTLDGGDGPADSGGAEETDFGMDDDMPLVTSVPSIKHGSIAAGTLVLIEDAIVTTPAGLADEGGAELYVEDREGGQYSGIVVRGVHDDDLLQPGALVDVVGRVRDGIEHRFIEGEAYYFGDEPQPAPLETSIPAIGESLAAYEGVLIRLTNLKVSEDTDGTPLLDFKLRLDSRFASDLPPLGPGDGLFSIVGVLMATPQGLAIGPRSAQDLNP